MDKDTLDNDGLEGEEMDKNLWLAALIIGILLILTILAIVGIVIWMRFKKVKTADENWAGPSPLADGNNHEDINISECIIGRHRSLSCISTAPIVSNELQAPQKDHVPETTSTEHSQEASTQGGDSKPNIIQTVEYISSEKTSFYANAPEGQQSKQNIQSYSLTDEMSLPPPPDSILQFPIPPQIAEMPVIDEMAVTGITLPLPDVPQSDEHRNQISIYQANVMDSLNSKGDIDDQDLPPPPADFF